MRSTRFGWAAVGWLLAAGLGLGGCSDDDAPGPTLDGAVALDGAAPDGDGAAADVAQADAAAGPDTAETDAGPANAAPAPLYVITTGVISGDDLLGYLATVPSLDASSTFKLSDAVEIGAGAWIFGREGQSSVYVASLFDPTIVRWDLTAEGKLTKGPTVSFANLGLSSAYQAAAAPIFSDEKSYFVDEDQDQIVVWNPHAMQVIGAIPLNDGLLGKLKPAPEGALRVSAEGIEVAVGWRDPDDSSSYGDHVRLVLIDPATNTIKGSHDEPRCDYLALSGQSSDGTSYYSPYAFIAAYRVGGVGHGVRSCALRIVPPAATFDQGFTVDLSALVGGRPAGDLTLLDDKTALVRAWHPDLVTPVTATNWNDVVRGEAGFKWWLWQIGQPAAVEIPNQQPGALGSSVFKSGAHTYVTRYAADGSSTSLVEIDVAGTMKPALQGPGLFIGNGAFRIR